MPKCKYITANLILCIHPISSMHHAAGFLVSRYNGFYHPQNILKFALQLTEDLNLCVIESECSSILTECGYHGQDAKESIRWKMLQGICSHMQCGISLMDGLKISMVHIFICLYDKIRDSTNVSAIRHPGMCTAFATALGVQCQYYLNVSIVSLAIVHNIFSHHKQKTKSMKLICYLDIYICMTVWNPCS